MFMKRSFFAGNMYQNSKKGIDNFSDEENYGRNLLRMP